jgi:hypothetical protein
MFRILIPFLIAAGVVGLIVGVVRLNSRRRGDATPELHKHPERLNQSLDPTDDA